MASKPTQSKPQASTTPTPDSSDVNTTALDAIAPLLKDMAPKDLRRRTSDARRACMQILRVIATTQSPKFKERFQKLPAELWDPNCIRNTEMAARALISLIPERESAHAQITAAKIDATLADDVINTRRRMFNLCNYYFNDDPIIGPELVDIGRGNGYLDGADDLVRLAKVCEEHRDVLSKDTKHYRAEDVDHARTLATQVHDQYDKARNDQERKVQDAQTRAWTLLCLQYEQVQRAVTFLFWDDPEVLVQFPPISTFGRNPRRGHAASGDTKTEPSTKTEPTPSKSSSS